MYLGNGDGTFSTPGNYGISFGGAGSAVAIGDFNGDGKLDIAAGGVLLGNGDGTFRGIPLGAAPGTPWSAVVGDFEKKGPSDIAIFGSNKLDILSLDANGTLALIHTYATPQQSYVLATADFNGDGNLDLLLEGANGFAVMLGNGDGTFQSHVINGPSPGSSVVAIADFNHDHVLDLAFAGGSPDELAISLGNGDGSFRSPVYYFDAGFGSPLIADFNGDGNLDIAVSGTDPTTSVVETGILFGNGDGTFQAMVLPTSLSGFAAAFAADFNNDGKPDLMGNAVALGNGDGTFTLLPPLKSPGNYGYFSVDAIADLNGDGTLDLLGTAGNDHPEETYIVFGNGDGTFAFGSAIDPMTSNGVPPITVAIADMNGDGRPDIVFPWQNVVGICANFCLGTPPGVAVLLNTTAPDFTISAASGSPTSQTVSAGKSATFGLVLTPSGSFSGMVSLGCAITPAVTGAPACSVSSSSVQISGSGAQQVTVTVKTMPRGSAGTESYVGLPPGGMPVAWWLMLLGSWCVLLWNRKRLAVFASPAVLLALALCVGCGGSGSSTITQTSTGTPAGTYTATITASSGTVNHNMSLQVIVQ